jgi:hypothetical protein
MLRTDAVLARHLGDLAPIAAAHAA